MGTKEEFVLAIRESIKPEYLNHFNKDRGDNPERYYEDKYAEPIKNYFKAKAKLFIKFLNLRLLMDVI